MQDVSVGSLMSRSTATVPVDAPVESVVAKMRVSELSVVVVLDGDHPIGTVSQRNLAVLLDDILAGRREAPGQVGDVMTSPPVTIRPTEPVQRALALIEATGVSDLVVGEPGGPLMGLVSGEALLGSQLQRVEMERKLLEGDLAERTRELVEANLRLHDESLEDHLLGIANRRAMSSDLDQIHELARRFKRPYCALLFDVDHFKAYNDHYGHQVADGVLRAIAKALGNAVRKVDRLYRYGGEEILAVLPETGASGVHVVSERARGAVETLAIPHEGSPHGVVTVSCGVCIVGEGGVYPEAWPPVVKKADEMLYRAKEAGRNCIEVAHLELV